MLLFSVFNKIKTISLQYLRKTLMKQEIGSLEYILWIARLIPQRRYGGEGWVASVIRTTLQVATITWGAGGRVGVGTTPRRPRVNTQRPLVSLCFLSFSLAPTIAIALEPLLIAPGHAIIMLPLRYLPSSDGWAMPTESLRHYGSYVGVHDCSLLLANFIYELDRMTIRSHWG